MRRLKGVILEGEEIEGGHFCQVRRLYIYIFNSKSETLNASVHSAGAIWVINDMNDNID